MNEKTKTSAIVKTAESALIQLTPQTVKAYINAKATDQEVAMFLNICHLFQLNPFKREAYLIKYGAEAASIVVGYEVYLKRAERSKNWAGFEAGTVENKATGLPEKAWIKVYRKDWVERPLYHEVLWAEYAQYKDEWAWNKETQKNEKTGNKALRDIWAAKPHTMLKKVAIEQGHRMAFPDEFSGMPYAIEEAGVDEELLHRSMTTIDKYPGVKPAEAHAAPVGAPDEFSDVPATEAKPPAEAHEGPSLAALEKFGKVVAELKVLGASDESIWASIHKFTGDAFGLVVTESRDFTTEQLELVVAFLLRKKATTEADRAKKNGVAKKDGGK